MIVPYARSGPRPRVIRLGDLGCDCAGLGAADWQVKPAALRRATRLARQRGSLAGLGDGSVEGAAKGASTGATVGSAVPIIGTAVGAVVGAIVGYLVGAKHYFNVGDSNAMCQQLMQAWQQYTSIQGHVAGRALTWSTMQQLFHAAVGAGLFPGNDMHLKFHEGTLQCAGHGDWVDDFLGVNLQGAPVNNCGAHNCMADALAEFKQRRASVPAGTPDAIYFVDEIVLPMNQSAQIPWVYNGAQNPQVHQLFYDLADAYLAQNVSGTTPYVEYPQAQSGTPTPGAEGAPAAAPGATPTPVSAPAPASPPATTVPYVSPPAAAPGAAPTQTDALVQSLLAQGASQSQAYESALAALQAQGVNVAEPAVQSQVAGAVAAAAPVSASSLLSGSTGLILIALGVGGAILLGTRGGGRRR